MTRVLLMIDDASVGGGQRYVLWLAGRLDPQRFRVSVVCEAQGYLVEELARLGITVTPLKISNNINPISVFRCAEIFRRLRPDIVHTHGGTAGFVGRIGAKVAGVRHTVHTYHGMHYLRDRSLMRRTAYTTIDRLLAPFTDRLVCVSHADYDLGIAHGVVRKDRTVVIRNGIDVRRITTNTAVSASRRSHKIVGTIGRLHEQKGHIHLLHAAAEVIRRCPSTRFQIVGEGQLADTLTNRIRELGLKDHVSLLGARTDTPELLGTFDVFVLPSLWEGLPLALLEAMAARKPIVASDVDGIREVLVDGRDGLLVPPANPAALTEAICRVLADDGLACRLAQAANERVVAEFDIATTIAATEKLYEAVLMSEPGKDQ